MLELGRQETRKTPEVAYQERFRVILRNHMHRVEEAGE
jgi:hypothetical protein